MPRQGTVIQRNKSVRPSPPSCTFISTLGRDDIRVVKPIPVTFEQEEDGSILASFMDANLGSGGETLQEAFESLQDLLVSSFHLLMNTPDSKLGPRMLREKRILLEFLCRSPKPTPKRPRKS